MADINPVSIINTLNKEYQALPEAEKRVILEKKLNEVIERLNLVLEVLRDSE